MKNVKKMLVIWLATLSVSLLMAQGRAMAAIIDFEVISAPDVFEPTYNRFLDYDFSMPIGQQFVTPAGVGILTQGYNYDPGPTNVDYNNVVYNDIHIQNAMDATGGGLFAPNNGTSIGGSHDDVVLSKADGSAFNLLQFEFAGYMDATTLYEKTLTVTGVFAGGGTKNETFASDGAFGFQLISLSPDWNNLSSVIFEHSGVGTYQGSFALDNIQVALATPVPLPAALFMFIPGLLGMGFVARRARK